MIISKTTAATPTHSIILFFPALGWVAAGGAAGWLGGVEAAGVGVGAAGSGPAGPGAGAGGVSVGVGAAGGGV
jgi:hypothetical protein